MTTGKSVASRGPHRLCVSLQHRWTENTWNKLLYIIISTVYLFLCKKKNIKYSLYKPEFVRQYGPCRSIVSPTLVESKYSKFKHLKKKIADQWFISLSAFSLFLLVKIKHNKNIHLYTIFFLNLTLLFFLNRFHKGTSHIYMSTWLYSIKYTYEHIYFDNLVTFFVAVFFFL